MRTAIEVLQRCAELQDQGEDEAFDEIFERVVRDVEHITRRMERAESGSFLFLEDYYRSFKHAEPASSEGQQHASRALSLSWPRPRLPPRSSTAH